MEESIINRIVRLIEEKGMKDKQFCDSINISQSTFANWKVRGSTPKAELIPVIAKALGVSRTYLLTGKDDSTDFDDLNDVYLSLAREAQKNAIAPEDIHMAIKMIKDIREREKGNK